jgi:hypothetical protein
MQRPVAQRAKENTMSTYPIHHPSFNGHWLAPVAEFLALRLLSAGVAAAIVYAGYLMFMH